MANNFEAYYRYLLLKRLQSKYYQVGRKRSGCGAELNYSDNVSDRMDDRRSAFKDLRWRSRAPFSPAETPRSSDPRGFIEDYGEDQAIKGTFRSPFLCLWRLRTVTVNPLLLAMMAVGANLLCIQMTENNVVKLASCLTIFLTFVLVLQQRKLKNFGSIRRQNNELRRQVHYLRQERERLHRNMDRLDEHVAELNHIPHELHRISQNQNVDRLLAIVEEQAELQDKIRMRINQQIMQQILTIVVREDRDQNWTLRPTEIEKIIVRVGMVEGIEFDDKLFRGTLEENPSVSTVFKILRCLIERDEEFQHGTPIFRFIPLGTR